MLAIDRVPEQIKLWSWPNHAHVRRFAEKLGDRERMRRAAFASVTQFGPVFKVLQAALEGGCGQRMMAMAWKSTFKS